MRLFHLVQFVKCWQIFQKLNSKDCNKDQEEKKDVDVLRSRPQQNVKVGNFTS